MPQKPKNKKTKAVIITEGNRSGVKKFKGSTQVIGPQCRPSLGVAVPVVNGHFYAVCSWSDQLNGCNSRLGLLLQESSGFSRCLFGPDLPKKACSWSGLGSLGRCGSLDRSRRSDQRPVQGWSKQFV